MTGDLLDTIVAPATPAGRSALAIVRIDGPRSRAIAQELTRGSFELEPRRATLAHLQDGNEPLDEGIMIHYAAPHSFTGNDLVEITLHGNPSIVQRVVGAVVRLGARIAEPGEFTERAVLNGKLDLVQAESIAGLINARTALQARLSLANLGGSLSAAATGVREQLLHVISRLEGALDFSEEGYEFISRQRALEVVEESETALRELVATHRRGRATLEGVSAVILGRPNAGKSSLLNALCGSDRAIVTELAGTTRDLLRETIEIGGLPVTLTDTAGLRETGETVERIGIQRAREAARRSDLILYLIDAAAGEGDDDRRELATLRDPIVVFTKTDLAAPPPGRLGISVERPGGISLLLEVLDGQVRELFAASEDSPTLVSERQRAATSEGLEALSAAAGSLREGAADEIVLVDLYRAAGALANLTGAISRDDVYREIFAKFCIGK